MTATIIGTPTRTGGITVPGWSLVINRAVGKAGDGLVAIWEGPAGSTSAAREAILALPWGSAKRQVSVGATPGKGLEEIRVTYAAMLNPPAGLKGDDGSVATSEGSEGQPAEDAEPIVPDVIELVPAMQSTALLAHPAFRDISKAAATIDAELNRGDTSAARAAAALLGDLATSYVELRLAGVSSYDCLGYTYTLTRTFGIGATKEQIANLSKDEGKVVAWSAVVGSSNVAEPTYTAADGTRKPYQWRCLGARVNVEVGGPTKVVLTYQGAWKWAGLLYNGGTWYPPAE